MSSNEKITAQLNDALQWVADDDDPKGSVAVEIWAVRGALELLRERESIAPSICGSKDDELGCWWYLCGKCKKPICPKDRFCKRCGQAVKWD